MTEENKEESRPSKFSGDKTSFTHIVIGDVQSAHVRLRADDSQTHRRELIRAVFAAIEGLNWQLKQGILRHAIRFTKLTPHEEAAMLEETYSLDARGNVTALPRLLPLTSAIRLLVKLIQRSRPSYEVDFGHVGWSYLKSSILVRNRIVHPKTIEDLGVTEDEVRKAVGAFMWVLALNIEAQSETKESYEELVKKLGIDV